MSHPNFFSISYVCGHLFYLPKDKCKQSEGVNLTKKLRMNNKNMRAKSIRMLNQTLASPRYLNAPTGIVGLTDTEKQACAELGTEMGIAVHFTAH